MWTFIENKNRAPNGSGNENQSDQGGIKRRGIMDRQNLTK